MTDDHRDDVVKEHDSPTMRYSDVGGLSSHADVESTIGCRDFLRLVDLTIAVGLYEEDFEWGQEILIRLAHCEDPTVRGNAVLSFGHFARRFRILDAVRVRPIIEAALRDPDWHVSGQAHAAADDVEHFLGWQVIRPSGGP